LHSISERINPHHQLLFVFFKKDACIKGTFYFIIAEYHPIVIIDCKVITISNDSSDLKKNLSRIYNQISKELFGMGAVLLRIEVLEDLIIFRSKHRRSPRSRILEQEVPSLQQEVDAQMSRIFKKRLRERLEIELGLSVETVLRDYDPSTPWTITNVIISD
jgi:hypothetical protein